MSARFYIAVALQAGNFPLTKYQKYLRILNQVLDHIMKYLPGMLLLIVLGFGLSDAQAENNDTWYVGEGLKKGCSE